MKNITTLKRLPSMLCLLLFVAVICVAQKPELFVQRGHTKTIFKVVFSPDGKTLASAGADNTVGLWDVATGHQLRTLKGHDGGYAYNESGQVTCVAFSAEGKMLAASVDTTIRLWDVTTGQELRTIKGNNIGVASVAFGSGGRTLVSINDTGTTVTTWDVATGQELKSLTRQSVPPMELGDGRHLITNAFSRDGSTLAVASGPNIELWQLATGRRLRTLPGHALFVTALAFSDDGKSVASGGGNTIKLWDVATGREVQTITVAAGHFIAAVALSSDGRTLAGASGDESGAARTIKLWDAVTGQEVWTIKTQSNIKGVAFSPDGQYLAGGDWDNTIKVWAANAGRELQTLAGHSKAVNAIALSNDGKILATCDDAMIKLWDVATGQGLRTLPADKYAIISIAISPNNKILVSGDEDSLIKVWDITTGRELRRLTEPVYDFTRSPTLFAFADDNTLASFSMGISNTIKLWDLTTGRELRAFDMKRFTIPRSMALSGDGKTLAVGYGNASEAGIKVWEVATGAEIRTLRSHARAVYSVAFSNESKILASGNDNNTITLWDVVTGQEVSTFKGHTGAVTAVAFSSDRRTLASASVDNTVRLWDIAKGQELHNLTKHLELITSIAFSNDGRTLVSGSEDATIKLWDVVTGNELATLLAIDQQDWLVVAPDGLFDGSPAAWNNILWRFSPNLYDVAPVETFFNEFYYPGLLADIFAGRPPKSPQDISRKDRRQPQVKLSLATAPRPGALRTRDVPLQIKIENAPAGAQDVRLFRNGSLVHVWHGDVLKRQSSANLEVIIPIIAGQNRLMAYAFNHDNIKSADAALTITGADSLRRKGTAYIIAVGVNQYGPNPFFRNLKYAVADADDFAAEVKAQQERLTQFGRVQVVKLTDDKATKTNLLGALTDLSKKTQPEDTVVVYFAGHGLAEGGRFYLIPKDIGVSVGVDARDELATLEAMLAAHGISDLELEGAFEGIDAGQLALIVDACNSGQALGGERDGRGPMNSKGLAQLAYDKGMYILTAAQSFQAAQEAPQVGHGLLTYGLIEEGLKQAMADYEPQDGQIMAREWFDYATRRVPEMQLDKMRAAKGRGLNLSFKDEERGLAMERRSGQRPRVFYRRELEAQPFIMAKTGAQQRKQ